jgi:hypothetical protein
LAEGRDSIFDAIALALLDHLHGLDAGDESAAQTEK